MFADWELKGIDSVITLYRFGKYPVVTEYLAYCHRWCPDLVDGIPYSYLDCLAIMWCIWWWYHYHVFSYLYHEIVPPVV